jgi:Fatty acid hydroxylase superfamily
MQVRKVTPDLSDRLADCGTRPAQNHYYRRATFYGGLDRCVSRRRNSLQGGASDGAAPSDGPMTAIIYFGEILVASLLAIVLLALSRLRMSSDAVLFAGDVVAWTLAEYVVHRFVLHGFAPTGHRLHHANPDAPVLTIFWQIWICFALVCLIVGGTFVAGSLVAYAWHHCAHHGPDKLPLPLLKHHQSHHRFATRNYGVSTTLWDHVFGTMLG